MKQILHDSIIVGLASKGAITLNDLKHLEYFEYKYIVAECNEVKEKLYNAEKE